MAAQSAPTLDDLLTVLETATDKGMIRWKPTADEDTFRAEVDRSMIRIARGFGRGKYTVTLIDGDGTVLEEYESTEETLVAITALYVKAREQALDLKKKVNGLYNRLKDLAGAS